MKSRIYQSQQTNPTDKYTTNSNHQSNAFIRTQVIVGMGIKGLSKLISTYAPRAMKEVDPKKYTGRLIAIDASVMIYQYLVPL